MDFKDKQADKFQLTFNNPQNSGFTHDVIKNTFFNNFKTASYLAMADEIGLKTSTYHTHAFLYMLSRVRVATIMKHFPGAHIEIVKGTVKDNVNYLTKSGKWENDKKTKQVSKVHLKSLETDPTIVKVETMR